MQVHRTVVRVARKEFITPNFLRVILKCDDAERYKDVPIGVNNKLFIPPIGQSTVQMPTFNAQLKQWEVADEALRPTVRTYTHRAFDLDAKELCVDFAVHEGESVACQWALNAKIGDEVGLAMKLTEQTLIQPAKDYLFVTDMTGIPVVAALVSQLPKDVNVTVLTEVLGEVDIHPEHYQTDANLTLHWRTNFYPQNGSTLFEDALPMIEDLNSHHFVHVTAEFNTVKKFRDHLRKTLGYTKDEFYGCAYWQIGKKEHEERTKRLE
ncbi:NADPH-dependent ferric siderophore reductase [Wohlfahrtiimonas chitiniclastica]|uniref:Siderophore-interacting protein n=1 Tax=Wohlfahrtiimonas chitiniclastica TaxID=400946 RepID=A0AB35BVI2_9GAMM|nr:siderophore-interacting protein [Wohlfahrtiimonas chitiniclastica]MBS7823721.1 siderophore-interacting protein [Wohlfahrtiimonas chitiniclastica]MBS7839339.1 siderophore-interacting protein [Wohlfahrtiimonas chitiniclastica]OYQ80339.1 NADPH-dependent ferric siderophore reductase [Wohlfahrtiimonas chitiniclastica]